MPTDFYNSNNIVFKHYVCTTHRNYVELKSKYCSTIYTENKYLKKHNYG